jgi:hypothetical protein
MPIFQTAALHDFCHFLAAAAAAAVACCERSSFESFAHFFVDAFEEVFFRAILPEQLQRALPLLLLIVLLVSVYDLDSADSRF